MSTEATQPEVQTPVVEQEQVQQQQVEQQPADAAPAESKEDADAAFVQGFNAANGNESPAPQAAPEPQPTPEPEQPAQPEAAAEPDPASMTPEQIRDLIETVNALKQREAKVFGTLGAMKQQLDGLKSAPQASAAVKLTKEKLKRLSAEFPELAEMLSEDLNEALQGGVATAAPTDQAAGVVEVEQKFNERLEEASRGFETKLLTVMHPDWKAVTATPEFRGWVETLPDEDKTQLANSWDATFIGSKLNAFKDWKNKTVQKQQTNQRRLETAVAPRGNPQKKPEPSANDAFVQGFNEARGIK